MNFKLVQTTEVEQSGIEPNDPGTQSGQFVQVDGLLTYTALSQKLTIPCRPSILLKITVPFSSRPLLRHRVPHGTCTLDLNNLIDLHISKL